MSDQEKKITHYDAFISYRHSELDMFVAKKVHKGLETFKVPKSVQKLTGKKSIARVFRDQEELPIGSDLNDNITTALENSEYLLVVCSPRTPGSEWVIKEINSFISMHGRDKVLAILIEGEPNESFPEPLLVDENGNNVEPLAADIRGKSQKEVNKKLKQELLRLCAPVLGCRYDDLRQRHRERKIRARMMAISVAAAIIAVLGISFGIYNAQTAAIIKKSYELAEKNRIQAEENYSMAMENLQTAQINQSKFLAETSLELSGQGDLKTASLVALAGLPVENNSRPLVSEAMYALGKSLNFYSVSDLRDRKPLAQVNADMEIMNWDLDAEGSYITVVDEGSNVYVCSSQDGNRLCKLSSNIFDEGAYCTVQSANVVDDQIIVLSRDCIYAFSMEGELLWKEDFQGSSINQLIIPQSKKVVVLFGAKALVYDLENRSSFWEITPGEAYEMDSFLIANTTGDKFAFGLRQKKSVSYMGEALNAMIQEDFQVEDLASLGSEIAENGLVCVADMTEKSTRDYATSGNNPHTGYFTQVDSLLVSSSNIEDLAYIMNNPKHPKYVDCLDLNTGEILWTNQVEVSMTPRYGDAGVLKSRVYEDSKGASHRDAVFSAEQKVYVWDLFTGEEKRCLEVSAGVTDVYLVGSTALSYISSTRGDIDIVDLEEGEYWTDYSLQTGDHISKLRIVGSSLYVQHWDYTITIYRDVVGPGRETIGEYEHDSLMTAALSPSEKYMSIRLLEDKTIRFYDFETKDYVNSYDPGEVFIEQCGFVDDEWFFSAENTGDVTFFNVETGESIPVESSAEFIHYQYNTLNAQDNLLLQYETCGYQLVDLEAKKCLREVDYLDWTILKMAVSRDNHEIYVCDRDKGLFAVDYETGEELSIPGGENYRLYEGNEQVIDISGGGEYLAQCCSDNKLRIMKLATRQTVAEIDFPFHRLAYVQFSEDGKRLYVQGDDHRIAVYDTTDYQVIAELEQRDVITGAIVENTENGVIVVKSAKKLYVYDSTSYGVRDIIPEGELAVFSKRLYITHHEDLGDKVYSFPMMTLEEMVAEQLRQFPGSSLTDKERARYHID